MARSLHLVREVKAYAKLGANYWEIPVLDGLSFSQATNITEVSVAEMSDATGTSRRGRLGFNDSLNPAEWSFSTYAQPFKSATSSNSGHHAAEEVLWALMAGAVSTDYTPDTNPNLAGTWGDVISISSTNAVVDFLSSDKLEFADASIIFQFPGNGAGASEVWYEISGAVVNEASVDFDLDGVTTINWSGFGDLISEISAPVVSSAVTEGLDQTGTFIRNRLTQLVLEPTTNTINSGSAYFLTLTGGNVTITNNIEFITPSSLNVVNRPLGSVNGTRTVTGNFTCYLDTESGANADASAELFNDLIAASTQVQNEFNLTFQVGGTTATPRVEFNFPTAMLEIPAHSIDDVVSVEVNFHGLPSGIGTADEMTVTYVGPTI